jgi:hypothetical protein
MVEAEPRLIERHLARTDIVSRGGHQAVMPHLKQDPPISSPVPRRWDPAARRGKVQLEIDADAFSDDSIRALVEAWFVPMVVDHIIESMIGYHAMAAPLPCRGNYEYDNFGSAPRDDKESKRWTATETRPAEADVETAIDVDGRGTQSA